MARGGHFIRPGMGGWACIGIRPVDDRPHQGQVRVGHRTLTNVQETCFPSDSTAAGCHTAIWGSPWVCLGGVMKQVWYLGSVRSGVTLGFNLETHSIGEIYIYLV